MVFYTWGEKAKDKYDPGFGKNIKWDIPLLDGYPYRWVENTSIDPGTHHFKGIINPGLAGEIELWNADALLVFGWAYRSHLNIIRHFKNKKTVYFRGDSTLLDNIPGVKNVLKSTWLKSIYKNVHHAFYTGSENKAYFKKYGLKESQLTFAPHSVDNSYFSENGVDRSAQLRFELGISDTDILVLFAGKFEQKKDPQILLSAINELKEENVHLLMVGNGPLEDALKATASGYKNLHIHWMDFQNQSMMPAIYHACDLFCLPSCGPGETWGLAVNEAMAAGKAVLVSDKVGCAADLVVPGRTGEIFIAGNLIDLKEKLVSLIENKSMLSSFGKNAKDRIASWSVEHQIAAITNILNKENAI